jgi:serine/alanine adding enzyme
MSKESNALTQAIECNISVEHDVPDWSGYLAHHPDATVYHDPRWGRILRDVCGGHPFFLTARRGGWIVGVFQLVGQRSFLFGSRLCSLPYFDASGILADDNQARLALLHKSKELRESEGYAALEVRQLTPCAENAPTRTDKVTLWLDIPAGSDAMWKQLKTKVRTKIRKVRKNDFEFASGGFELLDDFHDVYSRTMRDLGSPPHGKRIFERILSEFPEGTMLFVVRSDGQVLAASFTLADRWGFHVPWSGSDFRFRKLGANRFLYWKMLSYAAKIGAGRFDFGRSTIDSGTYGFKREWGAKPVQLCWQYFLPQEEKMPEIRTESGKYKLMTECWKKIPLPVARFFGPWIICQLS